MVNGLSVGITER